MSAADKAYDRLHGLDGLTQELSCPECEHPLDQHGYSGCMDSDHPGERDNLGFCVCMKTLAELLPPTYAAVRAEADAAGFRRGVEKLDNLRRQQAETASPCCETCRTEGWECSAACGRPCCVTEAATDWIVGHTLDRAEAAEAEVERLRTVLAEIQRAFGLQCPPMPADKYVDRGAWMAHSWWNTVLGGILVRAGLNTEDG